MGPTLQSLLSRRALRLRVVVGPPPGGDRLRTLVNWAHSSDLADPTPWLSPGGLLLTDGTQFDRVGDAEWAADYVARLADCGVAALGFATGVVHAEIPQRLVDACERRGLVLLEVAQSTPFMAIITFVNDEWARERRERLEWSLAAQRGVALAAMRPDGLNAVLTELERQLGCWVALYDAAGHRIPTATTLPIPEPVVAEVEKAVRTALARGTRSGARLSSAGSDITLQTLGRSRGLRGVLAVGTQAPLDPAAHDLVTSVIALASIALDQTQTIEDARNRLRAGLFQLMLAGRFDLANDSAEQLWGRLPEPPVRVTVLTEAGSGRTLPAELELYAARRSGRLFFAEHEDRLVLVTRHDDTTELREILQRTDAAAGCSTGVAWEDLPIGLAEARRAAGRATGDRRFVRFEEVVSEGMLGLLEVAGGASVARRMLLPLETRSAREQGLLVETARVWLQHKGAWDPAAKELGVHRHTLRNRIAALEGLLGLDLDQFADRAELWAALQLHPTLASESDVRSPSVLREAQVDAAVTRVEPA